MLAQLDADTRAYLRVLLNAGGTAFDDDATGADEQLPADGRAGPARGLQALRADRALRQQDHAASWRAAQQHQARDPQLPAALDGARRARPPARRAGRLGQRQLRGLRLRGDGAARGAAALPGALDQTETTLAEDRRSWPPSSARRSQRLRPFARNLGPALRKTQPFFRETTPIIRDQIRPFARDVQPTVRDLRSATENLAPVTPRLTRSFKVLNKFFNTLAYDPPGAPESVPLLERLERPRRRHAVHASRTRTARSGAAWCSSAAPPTQRSQRRAPATRSSACSTRLLNLPPEPEGLPADTRPTPGHPVIKQTPSLGRIFAMVAFALSCFGILIFLWLSFGGSVPLQPEGLPRDRRLPRGHPARPGGRRAHLRRAGRARQEEGARTRRPGSPTPSSRSTLATRRSRRTRGRSCARSRSWARPTWSCRRAHGAPSAARVP